MGARWHKDVPWSSIFIESSCVDKNFERDNCISHERCGFLPMSAAPDNNHPEKLPLQADLPNGQHRSYGYVIKNGRPTELYFVERYHRNDTLFIEQVPFLRGRTIETLFLELFQSHSRAGMTPRWGMNGVRV